MAALISASISRKGKPGLTDINTFTSVENRKGEQTVNLRCSRRKCAGTLTTRKSTGNLVGEELPDHSHGNLLLKKLAQQTESKVLTQYTGVQGALPSTILQEISTNMLSSSFPGQLSSASSAGAIRMKIWHKRQIVNPCPS